MGAAARGGLPSGIRMDRARPAATLGSMEPASGTGPRGRAAGPIEPPRSILVRLPNWLGDVVMATGALCALKERYPEARLTALGRRAHAELLRGLPAIDAFVALDGGKGPAAIVRQGLRLRSAGFDLGVLLPNSFSSAAIFRVAGIRERIGYDLNFRGALLTRKIRPAMDGHRRIPTPMPEYYRRLLELVDAGEPSFPPRLAVGADDEVALARYLAAQPLPPGRGPLVLLNAGASFGPSKLWRSGRFAAVGDRLQAEQDARIVVLAGPGEEGLAAEIAGAMRRPHRAVIPELLRLGALKALVRRADLLVTTDTGPRHVAVALGRPVVVLMGSTDPRHTNYGLERTTLIRKDVDCSPCHLKTCPIDHRCMERITVEEVVAAARARLSAGGRSAAPE